MSRKEIRAKALRLAVFGVAFGITGCTLIEVAVSIWQNEEALLFTASLLEKTGSPVNAFAVQTLLSGLIGAVCIGASIVYDFEKTGLLWASVIHYAVIEICFMPAAVYLGWVDPTIRSIGIMAGNQAIVFAAIWIIMDLKWRAEVRQLNTLLENCGQADYTS